MAPSWESEAEFIPTTSRSEPPPWRGGRSDLRAFLAVGDGSHKASPLKGGRVLREAFQEHNGTSG